MDKIAFSDKIEKFLKKYQISASKFGVMANKEPNFVFLVRKGRECREETQKRVLAFMAKYESEHKEQTL